MEQRILFLCTSNSARSQIAEALLRKHAGDVFKVYSAGTEPREQIYPPVFQVMNEIGIDIGNQHPKGVNEFLGKMHFTWVIIVCKDVEKNCPHIFVDARRIYWPMEDPEKAIGSDEEKLSSCRKIRDQIDQLIREWLKEQNIK